MKIFILSLICILQFSCSDGGGGSSDGAPGENTEEEEKEENEGPKDVEISLEAAQDVSVEAGSLVTATYKFVNGPSCTTGLTLTSSVESVVNPTNVEFLGTVPNCSLKVQTALANIGKTKLTVTYKEEGKSDLTFDFDLTVTAPNVPAFVVGQSSLAEHKQLIKGLASPGHAIVAGTKFFIADTDNNRVLGYNSIPTTNHATPDFVLGQPNMESNEQNYNGVSANGMNRPGSLATDGTKFFVADTMNNRVLGWNSIPSTTNAPADFVLGQSTLLTNDYVSSGVTTANLARPEAILIVGSRLVVADTVNHRVLIWNSIPSTNGVAANIHLGQSAADKTARNYSRPSGHIAGTQGFQNPTGLASDGTNLIVADKTNHRVLIYNDISTIVFSTVFDGILGQDGSTTTSTSGSTDNKLSSPRSLAVVGTDLYVADTGNNRVLIFETIPSAIAAIPYPADYALGQPSPGVGVINNGGITSSSLYQPEGFFHDGTKTYVADSSNNRILIWNSTPLADAAPADTVLGQESFVVNVTNNSGAVQNSLYSPANSCTNGSRFFVLDTYHNRILGWNGVPRQSGEEPDFVLGQPNIVSTAVNAGLGTPTNKTLRNPVGMHCSSSKLIVSDTLNNRVLIWNSVSGATNQAADVVLGQPDFATVTSNTGGVSGSGMSYPHGVYSDGTSLFVADYYNHRVLVWNTIPSATTPADFALGQPTLAENATNNGGPSLSSMKNPSDLHSEDGKYIVTDSDNNRILLWNQKPTASDIEADLVLGQPDETTITSNTGGMSAATLSYPYSAILKNGKVYVSDTYNNRVLVWNSLPTAYGVEANLIWGQHNAVTSTGNNPQSPNYKLKNPEFLSADDLYIYVADKYNDRILAVPIY